MELVFFDSNGLVKRYAQEKGTAWVTQLTDPVRGNLIRIAAITKVEVITAIKRKEREGGISPADANRAIAQFRLHLTQQYRVMEMTPPVLDHAMLLAENHILKAYDAEQLATALEANQRAISLGLPGVTFITADAQLLRAASAVQLAVENPKNHPLPTQA